MRDVVSGIIDVLDRRWDAFDRVSMIVVDSIGTLLAPLIGGMAYAVGHETMFSLAMFLKQIARLHSCVVLVTNHTVSGQRREGGYGGQTSVVRTFHAPGLEQAGYVLGRSALGGVLARACSCTDTTGCERGGWGRWRSGARGIERRW